MKYLRRTLLILLFLLAVTVALVWIIPLPPQADTPIADLLQPGQTVTDIGGEPTITTTWGSPKDPAILLIHGFGGNSFMWSRLGEDLSSLGYFVLAMDLRGFGLTDKSLQGDYTHRAQAQYIADIAAHYQVSSAITISHSMGANIALHLRTSHPALSSRLIFLDGAFSDPGPSPRFFSWILHSGTARRFSQHIYRRIVTPEALNSILNTASSHPERISRDIQESLQATIKRKDWDLALLNTTMSRPKNALHKLPRLNPSELLFIWGEKDTWISSSVGDEFRRRIADEQGFPLDTIPSLKIVPDAGHVVFLDQPEIVYEMVKKFLQPERPKEE